MKQRVDTYGGGGFNPALPNKNVVSSAVLVLPGISTDRDTIPANGTTFATLNYAGSEPSPHVWTVNGAVSNIAATLDAASGLMVSEVEVTAAVAGIIEVAVGGNTLTITVL